jgi:phosphate/sulfate permease
MIRFRDAALVGSVFVVLGAVFQGRGGAETLSVLGKVDSMAGAFIVSLSAALVVHNMNLRGLPVSTSQAIVGGIIGWVIFNNKLPDYNALTKIVISWVSGPILGMIFAALLYRLLKKILLRSRIHAVQLDTWIRFGLILAGAFGAYSLGANNIANVMGVFLPMAPDLLLDFGLFSLDGAQLLFLMGGLAIATGIYTTSRKVMQTVGNGLLSLSAEAAMVVVLSQALVMFLFSSSALEGLLRSMGLPSIPLVPVSSTQLVVGSILGIGMVKGSREINTRMLAEIGAGWLLTPLAAGITTYLLLFIAMNVFNLSVMSPTSGVALANEALDVYKTTTINLIMPGIIVVSFLAIALLTIAFFKTRQKQLKAENELLQQQNINLEARKLIDDQNLRQMHESNLLLSERIDALNREFGILAIGLTEQKLFLDEIASCLSELKDQTTDKKHLEKIQHMIALVQQKRSFTKEKGIFYLNAEHANRAFFETLDKKFPELNQQEKRLALLIKVGLSNKEMATMLNIAPKSVEVVKYRLKKRMGLSKDDNLSQFIENLN